MTETNGVAMDEEKVYYTTDKGLNWTPSFTFSTELSYYNSGEVICPDELTAYFISEKEGLYKSIDQGKNWSRVHDALNYDDISFASADTGFFLKYDTLFVTFDGGASWKDTVFYDHINSKSARFRRGAASSTTEWAVSTNFTIFVTDDAGQSWYSTAVDSLRPFTTKKRYDTLATEPLVIDSSQFDTTLTSYRDIDLVYFMSADTGLFFFQYEYVGYYTSNGGATWDSIKISDHVSGQNLQQFGDTLLIVPDYSHGDFPISYDRGRTWRRLAHGTGTDFRGYYLTSRIAWKHDVFSKTLVHTTDNWETYQRMDNGTGGFRWALWFFDKLSGICTGADGLYLRTDDGHETWRPADFDWINSGQVMAFIDSAIGFIGLNGTSSGFGLLRTTDQGETWTGVAGVGENAIGEIHFVGENKVFAHSREKLFYSPDKGDTWQELPADYTYGSMKSFLPFSDQEILTVTSGNYQFTNDQGTLESATGLVLNLTRDGGSTWSDSLLRLPGDFGDLAKVDSMSAFIGGNDGYLIKTEDRGATWTQVETNIEFDFNQIIFLDHNRGFAYANGEVFCRTFDGGKTWDSIDVRKAFGTGEQASQSTAKNERLFILDANHVWCAGPDMVTFRYTRHLHAAPAKNSYYPGERLTATIDGHNTNTLLMQYRRPEGQWMTIDSIAKADDIQQTWGFDMPVAFAPGALRFRVVDALDTTLAQYADIEITDNLPPVFSDQIGDTLTIAAEDTLVLDIAALFTDPEDHTMTFAFSGPSWATSAGTDSMMLTPVNVGEEDSVTLTATDEFGAVTEVTLFIEINEVGTGVRFGRLVYAQPRFLGLSRNGAARIVFSQTAFSRGSMALYNLQGRIIARKLFEIEPGTRVYEIPLGSAQTAQGRYYIIVDDSRTKLRKLFSVLR